MFWYSLFKPDNDCTDLFFTKTVGNPPRRSCWPRWPNTDTARGPTRLPSDLHPQLLGQFLQVITEVMAVGVRGEKVHNNQEPRVGI